MRRGLFKTAWIRRSTPYGYDGAGQLTLSGTQSTTYDANGNRTGAGLTTGPDNQLAGDGTWNYGYDGAGNVTSMVGVSNGLSWTYSYDAANELIIAKETSASTTLVNANYTFDAFGNRIQMVVTQSGTTTTTKASFEALSPPQMGADLTNWQLYNDSNGSGTLQVHYVAGEGTNAWVAEVVAGSGVQIGRAHV